MLFVLLRIVAVLLALYARHGVARLNQELMSQAARLRSNEAHGWSKPFPTVGGKR
jgi:hypothetical protein